MWLVLTLLAAMATLPQRSVFILGLITIGHIAIGLELNASHFIYLFDRKCALIALGSRGYQCSCVYLHGHFCLYCDEEAGFLDNIP